MRAALRQPALRTLSRGSEDRLEGDLSSHNQPVGETLADAAQDRRQREVGLDAAAGPRPASSHGNASASDGYSRHPPQSSVSRPSFPSRPRLGLHSRLTLAFLADIIAVAAAGLDTGLLEQAQVELTSANPAYGRMLAALGRIGEGASDLKQGQGRLGAAARRHQRHPRLLQYQGRAAGAGADRILSGCSARQPQRTLRLARPPARDRADRALRGRCAPRADRRSGASRPDPHQPHRQRAQIHRARRGRRHCRPGRAAVRRRRRPRLHPLPDPRHRHRHPARAPRCDLRGLHPGRRLHRPAPRRHRSWPAHRPRAGAEDGRRHQRHQHRGRRQQLPGHRPLRARPGVGGRSAEHGGRSAGPARPAGAHRRRQRHHRRPARAADRRLADAAQRSRRRRAGPGADGRGRAALRPGADGPADARARRPGGHPAAARARPAAAQLLGRLRDDWADLPQRVRADLDSGRDADACRTLHSLKWVAGNLGAGRPQTNAAAEARCRAGTLRADDPHWQALQTELKSDPPAVIWADRGSSRRRRSSPLPRPPASRSPAPAGAGCRRRCCRPNHARPTGGLAARRA